MLNSTQTLTCKLLGGSSWDLLKLETPRNQEKRWRRWWWRWSPSSLTCQASNSPLNEEKLKERRRREREEGRELCWDDEWTQMSSSLSYKPTFCIEPPSYFSNYDPSQMKGHLNQFTPNGITISTKVNVLLEIYVRVSRVSVFDEIRVSLY